MSVSKAELLCYEYINSVKDIEKMSGMGIYGLDKIRTKNHDKLCELMKLEKSDTLEFTDNLDKFESGSDLYIALLNKSRAINKKPSWKPKDRVFKGD